MPLQSKSDWCPHLQITEEEQLKNKLFGQYLLLVNKGLFQQNAADALLHGVFLSFSNGFLLRRRQLGRREEFLFAMSSRTVDDGSHL